MSFLPAAFDLESVSTGDTHPGLEVTGVTINEAAPTFSLTSVRMDLRDFPDAATASKALTSGGGDITIDDAAAWVFTVEPFLMDLAAQTYYYDLETTDANGTIRTYLSGTVLVAQDVTRT